MARRKKSNFTGPGRKLFSDEVVLDQNEDYHPSESDTSPSDLDENEVVISDCDEDVDEGADADPSESEGEEEEEEDDKESVEEVESDEEIGNDYVEVVDNETKKVTRKKSNIPEQVRRQKQKEGVLKDNRFEQSGKNGMLRAARVIKEHEANIGMAFSAVDMSDVGKRSLSAKTRKIKYKECANGMWEPTGKKTKKGKDIFRLIKNPTNNAPIKPCGCRICLRRADFRSYSQPDKPLKSNRSGLKRGFFKYGEGNVLGGEGDEKRVKTE
ncbi:uncharacterized protein Bfra_006051 [Botrytis fragariae]|uniref:Uncharacterized protein n=1 Tax=Botrytis fragariae TaxID=1964551 RepID=A0A8H6EHS4_9HELO|nr:uncharacterized protein Bfra_006051 [Botrytis fragariae]KAF5872688.1 hypothetical protein Bfra_006051 [Botrytis fragariae]